ncbi:MAG TPA: HAMP domain-containing protein, partial [Candidatus Limnocylindria bacterium]
MSFRLRVTLFIAAAVAVAAIGASVAMYLVVQDQLITQVDKNLQAAASGPIRDSGPFRRGPGDQIVSNRPEVFGQIINASGTVVQGDGGYSIPTLVTAQVKDVAAGKAPDFFATAMVGDARYEIYVKPIQGGAIQVVQQLAPIDAALAQTRLLLIAFAAGAILLAAALGTLIGRAALAPVKRLTATVEEVTRTRDLSRRVAAQGRDELSRLGTSFDAMLGQLETSLRSQRQLVADASHELRTPLTSLRTNLELLERGQPTDPVERQQLL